MREKPLIAVLDASVLYSAPLRDFLLRLALADLFQARWTNEIHEEWINAVLRTRPDLTLIQLQRTRTLMNVHVRNCIVTDYERVIPQVVLPDNNDRHVVAAAIVSQADTIVTFNLKDFPNNNLASFGILAQHPDSFIFTLIQHDPETVEQTAEVHRQALKNPSKSKDEYIATLEQQGLVQTVAIFREWNI